MSKPKIVASLLSKEQEFQSMQAADVPFTGCDGLVDGGQRLVNTGQLAATVILQSTTAPAIELVAAQLRTGAAAPARTVLAPRPYPA